jgi:hypothetical protein
VCFTMKGEIVLLMFERTIKKLDWDPVTKKSFRKYL